MENYEVRLGRNVDELYCPLCGDKVYGTNICDKCSRKMRKELSYFVTNDEKKEYELLSKISNAYSNIIDSLSELYGFDRNDPNFTETPERVTRLMLEMNYGMNTTAAEDILKSSFFPTNYVGMISAGNIRVSSLCPHHMVVVNYNINFAYIPKERCIGLSKIGRYLDTLANGMKLQEDFTQQAVDIFDKVVQPMGCAVMVTGLHNCISARGAKMLDLPNTTTSLKGVFALNPNAKQEWLDTIRLGNQ